MKDYRPILDGLLMTCGQVVILTFEEHCFEILEFKENCCFKLFWNSFSH